MGLGAALNSREKAFGDGRLAFVESASEPPPALTRQPLLVKEGCKKELLLPVLASGRRLLFPAGYFQYPAALQSRDKKKRLVKACTRVRRTPCRTPHSRALWRSSRFERRTFITRATANAFFSSLESKNPSPFARRGVVDLRSIRQKSLDNSHAIEREEN